MLYMFYYFLVDLISEVSLAGDYDVLIKLLYFAALAFLAAKTSAAVYPPADPTY